MRKYINIKRIMIISTLIMLIILFNFSCTTVIGAETNNMINEESENFNNLEESETVDNPKEENEKETINNNINIEKEVSNQENTAKAKLSIQTDNTSLLNGNEYILTFNLTGSEFVFFSTDINYNKKIFKQLTEDDIEIDSNLNGWDVAVAGYEDTNNDKEKISIFQTTGTSTINGFLMKIHLHVIDDSERTEIEFTDLYCNNDDFEEFKFTDSCKIIYKENTITKEKFYLSSNKYKIGNEDIKNYNEKDQYISRVNARTKLNDFKDNLYTNGEIKVIKKDGTELTDEEYVGTGMILSITKGEANVKLSIAVKGDLDGNGKITAYDFAYLNNYILEPDNEKYKLENEYKLAVDFDENDKITATDFAKLNDLILNG